MPMTSSTRVKPVQERGRVSVEADITGFGLDAEVVRTDGDGGGSGRTAETVEGHLRTAHADTGGRLAAFARAAIPGLAAGGVGEVGAATGGARAGAAEAVGSAAEDGAHRGVAGHRGLTRIAQRGSRFLGIAVFVKGAGVEARDGDHGEDAEEDDDEDELDEGEATRAGASPPPAVSKPSG